MNKVVTLPFAFNSIKEVGGFLAKRGKIGCDYYVETAGEIMKYSISEHTIELTFEGKTRELTAEELYPVKG